MGHRAWFAWKCLPRDSRGNPPSWRELEGGHGLTNGSIYKIVWDRTTRPSYEQISKVAAALSTTPEWLQREEGAGPLASVYVEPRPVSPEQAKLRPARSRPTLTESEEASFAKNAAKLIKRSRSVVRRDARK
jgi:hypothetical protein